MAAPADAELRGRLAAAKLRALARDHFGISQGTESGLGTGAGVHDGRRAVVLTGEPSERALGAALAWADRCGVADEVHVLVDDPVAAGVLARRARLFVGAIQVSLVDGRQLRAVDPAPHLPVLQPPVEAFAAVVPLVDRGATVVVEHGVVMAEIDGLEVGRVVEGPDGTWALEVGVGRYDREASAIMATISSDAQVTAAVVDVVRAHRRPDVSPHLLNRLGRQRWLRSRLLTDPTLVGATQLEALEPPLPRENLIDPAPALASGVLPDGRAVVVAASVGVDLDLVPTAADARDRFRSDAELVLVLPPRDVYPVVHALALRLLRPATVVELDGEWPH